MSGPNDEFVTVYSTRDHHFVEMMAVKLRDEGIAVTHPGTRHSSLWAGIFPLPVSMQVPRSRAEEARALIAEALPEQEEQKPIQPTAKTHGMAGAVLGLGAAVAISAVLHDGDPTLPGALFAAVCVAGTVTGYAVERWLRANMQR
jgi:hypothetical protein